MTFTKQILILAHEIARQRAVQAVLAAPVGWVVRVSPPQKSRDQEERYHAMVGDIARQWEFCGRRWDAEDMKRLLVDQFRRDTIKDPEFAEEWRNMGQVEMAPSLDGSGVVALGVQTRRFTKKLASGFIDWLFALGAEHDVRWTNEVARAEFA